jgi:hypothetical protein
MKAREIYNLIQTGNQQDAQQALFAMLALTQELSTAMFEVAYEVKQLSLRDPMGQRSRQWLSEFLELPRKEVNRNEL